MTLDELQALCDKATPGPWRVTKDQDDGYKDDAYDYYVNAQDVERPLLHMWNEENEPADAEFIAAARTHMPILIKIARHVEAEALLDRMGKLK